MQKGTNWRRYWVLGLLRVLCHQFSTPASYHHPMISLGFFFLLIYSCRNPSCFLLQGNVGFFCWIQSRWVLAFVKLWLHSMITFHDCIPRSLFLGFLQADLGMPKCKFCFTEIQDYDPTFCLDPFPSESLNWSPAVITVPHSDSSMF